MGGGANPWRRDLETAPENAGADPAALERLAERFAEGLAAGYTRGAQLAVYRAGRRVLDAGGGLARERTAVPVAPDTLFVTFSATKGLTALALLMLYERGALHYDEPIAKYWPEFASRVPAKAAVTIRHVLSHRGGFPLGPDWLTTRWFGDRAALRRAMEEVPLAFVPGEKNAYHPLNFGHVLNELVERIDGRDCGAFLREEVFEPLGLRDLYLGLPDDPALEARVAWCYNEPGEVPTGTGAASAPRDDAERERKLRERFGDTPELAHGFNRPETHRAVLPAAGAIGSARDLGRVYAALALGGELDGAKLATREGLASATAPTNRPGDVDGTVGLAMRWGTGFHLGEFGRGSSLRSFGHAGTGGQVAFADPDRQLAFAFLCNGETGPRFARWRHELQSLAFAACQPISLKRQAGRPHDPDDAAHLERIRSGRRSPPR